MEITMNNIDFWKKVLFVIGCVFVFRIGSHIPVPGINLGVLSEYIKQFDGTMVEILNTFSGGSVKRFSILTIGIMPYISASIIIQMLSFFNPYLKQLKSEGGRGQIKLNSITKKLTLIIAVVQATSLSGFIASQGVSGEALVNSVDFKFYFISTVSLVTGTLFLIWLSEKLTEYGIGAGVSIIIFVSIISGTPETISAIIQLLNTGEMNKLFLILLFALFIGLIYVITLFENSQRRIKLSSNNKYNETNYLPLKINMAGIMPAIFASMILFVPATFNGILSEYLGFDLILSFQEYFGSSKAIFILIYALLIMFFSFFYTSVIFNPKKTAEDLQSSGSFIKGVRPGEQTESFLRKSVKRLTAIGSIYMAIICVLPEFLVSYMSIPFYLGGTSLLIMVLVSKEWISQYEMSNHSDKYKKIESKVMENFK
jgi:preprotein translocase subunit SecY